MDTSNPANPSSQRRTPDEYELKIDDQVTKFLDLNHKVTFFVITAAIGTLAFSLNFVASNKLLVTSNIFHFTLLVAAAILALLSAWAAIMALNQDVKSFRLHLRYRYERKTYNQLTQRQQDEWGNINHRAGYTRRLSFVC